MTTEIDRLLPLTPRFFHILLALTDGRQHGYRIMKDVEAASGGRVRIGPGTLYEAIHRLVHKGLLQESTAPPDSDEHDERRRYYELTSLGRRVLEAEAARLSELVHLVRRKRILPRKGAT